MSKKKQLTGKQTKLAKLPLTRVLSQKMDEGENWEPAPNQVAEAAQDKQMTLSWERLEEGAAGLLTAAYLLILQDLVSLQAELTMAPDESPQAHAIPVNLPPTPQIRQALRQARMDLSDLYHSLA